MSLGLILAFVWGVVANLAGMLPSNDHHWRRAYALIATGLPILAMVFWQSGVWLGLIVLIAGISVLRWPVRYLMRWLGRQAGRG
jgi:hypothetical protein